VTYIKRNAAGDIMSAQTTQIEEGEQWVEDNNPELLDFLKAKEDKHPIQQFLVGTDFEMVRVIEDLIDLLVAKQVFVFTELPVAVQSKLNARKELRKDLNPLETLIGDSDDIF